MTTASTATRSATSRADVSLTGFGNGRERAHPRITLPTLTVRKSSYRSLASLQRDTARCRACAEAGYPLESLPVRAPFAGQRAYMFGQAPGVVEGEERLPWRGRAGRTLRRWLELDEDAFYATFYCASVTRCYPGRAPSGRGDRTPTPREQELCELWRDWELELLRPRLIVTVGGLALRRLLGLTRAHGVHRRALRAATASPSSLSRTRRARAAGRTIRRTAQRARAYGARARRRSSPARRSDARAESGRGRLTLPSERCPVPCDLLPAARVPRPYRHGAPRLDRPRRRLAGGADRARLGRPAAT